MKEKIYLMGDIHGSFKPVRAFHQQHNTKKEYNEANKTLILLGDAGLNYFLNSRDNQVKKKLGKYPFTYFVIRGNHEERPSILFDENPSKWHVELFWDNLVYVENGYPYIKYAMDTVTIYTTPCNHRVLVIPGAYSVDKYHRLANNWSWFAGEQLSPREMDWGREVISSIDNKCDIVLSHTCPAEIEPTDLFLDSVDQSTVDKRTENYLSSIAKTLDFKLWFFGHYHAFRDYRTFHKLPFIMLFDNGIDLDDYLLEEKEEQNENSLRETN